MYFLLVLNKIEYKKGDVCDVTNIGLIPLDILLMSLLCIAHSP